MAEISLNEIISVLSDTVGQPFNVPLQEKLKVIINYKRANYLQQSLEKHPEQRRFFQQTFTTDLEKIAPGDCEIPNITCDILRTNCEIPFPIRSSWSMFDYVGTPDWMNSYGEVKPEFNNLRKFNRYTADLTKWAYINKKIYVFNNLKLKKLSVRSVFSDPYAVNQCCSTENCFDDNSPFPIPPDLLNAIIRDILQVELKMQFPEASAIPVPMVKDTDRPITA